MIVQLRIDDRLIHGQVALVWSKELNTPRIIVANDEASVNDTVKMTLKMATPTGIKLIVNNVNDAIELINDPRAKDLRIFGLTKNVKDALKVAKACGSNVCEVNLANAGQFDADTSKKTRLPGNRVSLTESEMEAAKELVDLLGDKFFSQLIPVKAKEPISKLIKAVSK